MPGTGQPAVQGPSTTGIILTVTGDHLDHLLAEQISYYRARAPEYEAGVLELWDGDQLEAALDSCRPSGDG